MRRQIGFAVLLPSFALPLALCTSTEAGLLYMHWASDFDSESVALAPGQNADIEIYVDLIHGDSLSSLGFTYRNTPVDVAEYLELIAANAEHPSFDVSASLGSLTSPTTQVNISPSSNLPDLQPIQTPGTFLLATTTIQVSGHGDGQYSKIMFERHPTGIDAAGEPLEWDARYATTYSGYMAYGDFGSPGWCRPPVKHCGLGREENPLVVLRIPEPTGMMFAMILAFALIWRR